MLRTRSPGPDAPSLPDESLRLDDAGEFREISYFALSFISSLMI